MEEAEEDHDEISGKENTSNDDLWFPVCIISRIGGRE
jgi:hypothetical protein